MANANERPRRRGGAAAPRRPPGPSAERKRKQASRFDRRPLALALEDADGAYVLDRSARLGQPREFDSGLRHWRVGGGDTTCHIQTHFERRDERPRSPAPPRQPQQLPQQQQQRPAQQQRQQNGPVEGARPNGESNGARADGEPAGGEEGDAPPVRNGTGGEEAAERAAGGGDPAPGSPDGAGLARGSPRPAARAGNDADRRPSASSRRETAQRGQRQQLGQQRKRQQMLEDEPQGRDEAPLSRTRPWQESLVGRCACVSNIVRSLSFVPGNDAEMARHPGLLVILGRLVLLCHVHPDRRPPLRQCRRPPPDAPGDEAGGDGRRPAAAGERGPKEEREEPAATKAEKRPDGDDDGAAREPADGAGRTERRPCGGGDAWGGWGAWAPASVVPAAWQEEWLLECVETLRENALVTLANIAGRLDLSLYAESVCLPVLDGLLHWAVCPAAEARDPFPSLAPCAVLSPQRLALETLSKLGVQEGNVDLILATPPFSRLECLLSALVRFVAERRNPVCREMSVALLASLVQGGGADGVPARAVARHKGTVGSLVCFLEDGLMAALQQTQQQTQQTQQQQAQQQGGGGGGGGGAAATLEPPSVDMLRRAAGVLLALARLDGCRAEFVLYEGRLLDIAMSHILNPYISPVVADVLYVLGHT